MSHENMTSEPNADVSTLSYEQARDELAATVSQLEQGSATLEHSLQLWERGTALADRCEEWLAGAKRRLDRAANDAQEKEQQDTDAGQDDTHDDSN